MKRRATAILLGIMVSSMFLSACGKNEAKEAANESAQVEEEGVGEVTEEGEKVEAENKNASDADDSSKTGDSAKSDEDNKETSVKEEEDGDSSGKDSDDESEEDVEVTEASAGTIGVLLSDDDEDAKIDSKEMTSQIEDGGYEADVKNAGGDPALQISQIQEFIDEQVSLQFFLLLFYGITLQRRSFFTESSFPFQQRSSDRSSYFSSLRLVVHP